jgi:hypothetical protein
MKTHKEILVLNNTTMNAGNPDVVARSFTEIFCVEPEAGKAAPGLY